MVYRLWITFRHELFFDAKPVQHFGPGYHVSALWEAVVRHYIKIDAGKIKMVALGAKKNYFLRSIT